MVLNFGNWFLYLNISKIKLHNGRIHKYNHVILNVYKIGDDIKYLFRNEGYVTVHEPSGRSHNNRKIQKVMFHINDYP